MTKKYEGALQAMAGGINDGWRLKGKGPFIARSASSRTDDWPLWYVAGPNGVTNVLTFADKPGAMSANRQVAERIAEEANRRPRCEIV